MYFKLLKWWSVYLFTFRRIDPLGVFLEKHNPYPTHAPTHTHTRLYLSDSIHNSLLLTDKASANQRTEFWPVTYTDTHRLSLLWTQCPQVISLSLSPVLLYIEGPAMATTDSASFLLLFPNGSLWQPYQPLFGTLVVVVLNSPVTKYGVSTSHSIAPQAVQKHFVSDCNFWTPLIYRSSILQMASTPTAHKHSMSYIKTSIITLAAILKGTVLHF